MADSRLNGAEHRVQLSFIKSTFFSALIPFALVLAFQQWLAARRPPLDLSARLARVDYAPVALASPGQGLRLAGAWAVKVDDPRFGDLSGLAVEQGKLLGLSDSGFLFRLDPPGGAGRASIQALPAVAGDPRVKAGRDAEAIAPDPRGRGWWVAFEGRHALLLYDRGFTRLLRRVPLAGYGFGKNRGVEALVARGGGLTAIPEAAGVSDAAVMPDGRIALLHRWFGPAGFGAKIVIGNRSWRLPVAPYDNAEGIAAAPLPDGGTRLWIVTDNDALPLRRTLLVAVDVSPTR